MGVYWICEQTDVPDAVPDADAHQKLQISLMKDIRELLRTLASTLVVLLMMFYWTFMQNDDLDTQLLLAVSTMFVVVVWLKMFI
jgi:hypothetical protein